mgnify:CR=1 FL=1
MICKKCGSENPNEATVCGTCGASLINATQVQAAAGGVNQFFVDPEEKLLGTLGNGYAASMVFGKFKKCQAMLTDKRFYFQGRFFTGNGKNLTDTKCEKIVDLEDISGTGFIYSDAIGIIGAIIAILVPWVVCIILGVARIEPFGDNYGGRGSIWGAVARVSVGLDILVILFLVIKYFLSKKIFFMVEYAGGGIRFDAKLICLNQVKEFQRQINRAKDRLKKQG